MNDETIKIEYVEFLTPSGKILHFTIKEIISDTDNFLIFIDKKGLKQQLSQNRITRRWEK